MGAETETFLCGSAAFLSGKVISFREGIRGLVNDFNRLRKTLFGIPIAILLGMEASMNTIHLFNQDVRPYGAGDRVLNEQQAIQKALMLSVAEVVPFFVAASPAGHVAVGRIGHVDAEVYSECVGLAFEGKFIAA
jgi:hypothetical protein